jgi:multiple sugar transport system permease protein
MAKTKVKVKGLDSSIGLGTRRVIAYTVLILISILCLFWFYVLFVNATRSHGEMTKGFTPVPSTHLWENWQKGVLKNSTIPFVRGMFNSLFVATTSAVLCTYFSTMTAYAIHAYRFKGRDFIFTFILLIMTIPTQISAMGFINLVDKMNLINSYVPLIVPAIAAPATFFYMKQYMESALPLSLIEAARIDGSSEFNTFNRIVLPLMKPAIAVQAIFGFVGNWNNYFTPALVLKGDKATLPVMIALLRSADFLKFNMGHVYVAIAFSIFPVILVYLILSKHIVQGVAMGSVKG